jgi:hypothetical protein
MPSLLSQAASLTSEYFNDSHSRVLTRHWLFHRASRPPGAAFHRRGMGGMGWDDLFELRGMKAAHVIGGCRES